MSAGLLTTAISWAVEQYEAIAATKGRLRRTGPVRQPNDPPEVERYYHSIGLGRHVDAYA